MVLFDADPTILGREDIEKKCEHEEQEAEAKRTTASKYVAKCAVRRAMKDQDKTGTNDIARRKDSLRVLKSLHFMPKV